MSTPTNIELLRLIAERLNVDVSALESSTERTELILLRAMALALGNGGANPAFDGNRPILRESLTTTGQIIGGTTVTEFLENYFYPALSPLAILTVIGASVLEYNSQPNINGSLSWQVEKRTNPITSINVAGFAIEPTGENQNGNQAIMITCNQTNTFSIIVSDGNLSNTKQAKVYFRHGYYWGAMADISNVTDADIMALSGAGVGTGKVLDTNRQKTYDGIDGAGNYLVFAFPQSWGAPTFVINGLPNSAYTKVRQSNFVNELGYSEPYQIWASNTKQNSTISLFEIQ
ncbi:hypothetical protein [Lentimicrobium sp. S6]|uniref:hypothetical protein n=1 Tax=Lentimicrobium sp. S6 TaxID=2735872 RepID=UPI001557A750|nr:hypothetical protein [Lentimicrobium sp. S6]NPD47495.1 hypothetical protein [Lentimicrobium sp. S6]